MIIAGCVLISPALAELVHSCEFAVLLTEKVACLVKACNEVPVSSSAMHSAPFSTASSLLTSSCAG